MSTENNCGCAPVNGLKLYYETHGRGEPLILLHGGLGALEMFNDLVPLLTPTRQVILVDLQGHGRTADIDRPFSFDSMADDVAGLIAHCGIGSADVMGYSLGAGVAFRAAVRHPHSVRRLVLLSIAFKTEGWYPALIAGREQSDRDAAEALKNTPFYELYASVAPRPADWPVLVAKMGELARQRYDWSKDVAAITARTLLVFGDADSVRPAHAVEFFELLGGGQRDGGWDGSGMSSAQLAILPGVTHYNAFSSPALPGAVTSFLDAHRRKAKQAH
jgi:pimeloyl-ACP methyl ester carboxylesterase